MAHVFISHSSKDEEQAAHLVAWLRGKGFNDFFLDFDKHAGLAPGSDWERTLYREVAAAEAVILLLTANWFESKWCFAEFTQARALGKAIFPLVETPSGETFVASDIQHIDLVKDRDGGLDRLSLELTRLALNARGGFAWDPTRSPFPGLLSFSEPDAAIYFGRDDDIRRLIERLNARRAQGGEKLLVLLGASGSGKSSLLRAGVLPRLKRDPSNWLVLPPFRPQIHPIDELAQTFTEALGHGQWRQVRDALTGADPAHALSDLARDLRAAHGHRQATILVSIDQGEELFGAADKDEAERFFALLTAMLDEHLPYLVLLCLRADFLGHLQQAPHLDARSEEFSLKPMPLERVRDIIEGPARVVGLTVEDALISAAIKDAATDDALPLLAFALRELYDRFGRGGRLALAAYEAFGDAQAGLSPLANAVRRRADQVIEDTKPTAEELQALKEAFVPAMVRVNAAGEYVRRPAELDRLPRAARRLIERLVAARLLILRDESGTAVVEVTHEALLRNWPLLRGWLDQEREFLIGKDQLEQDLRDWTAAADIQKDEALLSGLKLTRARAWMLDRPQQLTDGERKYIQASIDRHEQEAARRERRRRFIQIASLAASLVLAIVAGAAIWQRNLATANLKQAEENYRLALDQATGSLQLLKDKYDSGDISTELLQALVKRSQEAVRTPPSANDTDEVTAARIQFLDVLSLINVTVGDPQAIETAETAARLADRLRDKDSKNRQYQRYSAIAHGRLSDTLMWQCDCARAAREAAIGVDGARQLLAVNPDDDFLHHRLDTDYETIGDSLRLLGDLDGADAAYRIWVEDAAATAAQRADDLRWQGTLAFATERIGDEMLLKDNADEAIKKFDEYSALANRLVTARPHESNYLSALAQSHQRLGDAWLAKGDLAQAKIYYQRYVDAATTLTNLDPSNFRFRGIYAAAFQRMGDLLLAQDNKDYAGAAEQFVRYLTVAQEMFDKTPDNNRAIYDLSNAHEKVGDVLRESGDLNAALKQYRESLRLAEMLAAKNCQNGAWQKMLAMAHHRMGITLKALADAAALKHFQQCAAVPLKSKIYSPTTRWPADVTATCRDEAAAFGSER